MDKQRTNGGLSAFSVLLVMAALSIVGIASLPLLNVQYKPSTPGSSINVSYSYPSASPEVVEAEVTSKIEAVMSRLGGCISTSSVSRTGSGRTTVSFRKGTDMAVARLEVASAIRNLYTELPSSVSYPSISLDASGQKPSTSVSYRIRGSLPSQEIEKYAREHIMPALSVIDGVDNVSLSGATPYHWIVRFDELKASSLGISASDISEAFRAYYSDEVIGLSHTSEGIMAVKLTSMDDGNFGDIPVANVAGRVVYLGEIADWKYQESLPTSYYRINGLNTVTVSLSSSADVNLLSVVSAVKERMMQLQTEFPEELSVSLAYDASEYVSAELNKIYLRTGLCLLILLLFVFAVSRSWRYMLIIVATLFVNLLISLAIYAFAGISIHIYTLAGITVSLGIIIDTSIVMIDHYARFRNRKAFASLLAAVGTTVAALLLVLLLPEKEKANLTDFIWVIVLNLSVSLMVSYLFIPALMHYLPVRTYDVGASMRKRRRQLKRRRLYERYIAWGIRHKWVYVLVLVIGFGIPLCVLPQASSLENKKDKNTWDRVMEKIVGWKPYADNRNRIDDLAGTSFAAFYKALDRSNFYREPQPPVLTIRAGMLEGATVHQLNDVVKSMENFLAGFDEIKVFTTTVSSYDNAQIQVEFKPEYEYSYFPLQLKSEVTRMAINFGGANWSVYGIDENGFNNNIVTYYKSNAIRLIGYNYKDLLAYAEYLQEYLSTNRRVSELEIWGAGSRARPRKEFNMRFDFYRMASLGITPRSYYSSLSSRLYDSRLGTVFTDGEMTDVVLRSSELEEYDLWHVLNAPVKVDSLLVSLSDVGDMDIRLSGVDISRSDQSYELNVVFNFIGSYELSRRVVSRAVDHMNDEVLPIGYKAENQQSGWFDDNKDKYAWLIFLIVAVIYVMLAITFESLRLPLAVILMIPIAFIGLFLTFGLSDLSFDQGGFAAFVMLCGIVVNAGIYLLLTYKQQLSVSSNRKIRAYVRAFGIKITPIMLTIISTVLGLIPFLTDGPDEVFWFDFAIGTISGMLFSLIAIFFYLPVFAVSRDRMSAVDSKARALKGY